MKKSRFTDSQIMDALKLAADRPTGRLAMSTTL
jgi:hypothetical protein